MGLVIMAMHSVLASVAKVNRIINYYVSVVMYKCMWCRSSNDASGRTLQIFHVRTFHVTINISVFSCVAILSATLVRIIPIIF